MLGSPHAPHPWTRDPQPPPGTHVRIHRVDDAGHFAWRIEHLDGGSTGSGLFASPEGARGHAEDTRGWEVIGDVVR